MKRNLLILVLSVFIIQTGLAQQWTLADKICPADVQEYDYFGEVLYQNEEYLIVSSLGDYNDGVVEIESTQLVHIFEKTVLGKWERTQRIFARSGHIHSTTEFGSAATIIGDYLFVSNSISNFNMTLKSGIVYVYKRDRNGKFIYETMFQAQHRIEEGYFGQALATNGEKLFVGHVGDSYDANGENYIESAGAVEMYELDENGDWVFEKKFVSPERRKDMEFGLRLSAFGNGLAVLERSASGQTGPSKVHYFEYSSLMFNRGWYHEGEIVSSYAGEIDTHFGSKIVLKGSLMIIGEPHYPLLDEFGNVVEEDRGAVNIYIKQPITNNWVRSEQIIPHNVSSKSFFGTDLAYNGDFLVVSAPSDGSDEYGIENSKYNNTVLIYKKMNNVWAFAQKLVKVNNAMVPTFGTYGIGLYGGELSISDVTSDDFGAGRGQVHCYTYEPGTGIFELEQSKEIAVYPNPAANQITLDLGDVQGATEISIKSITGAEVFRRTISSKRSTLNLENLEAGIYILSVYTSGGVISERIIVD